MANNKDDYGAYVWLLFLVIPVIACAYSLAIEVLR
jgi:hypothetical protein